MPFGRPKRAREPLTETELLDYAAKSLGARMQSERDLRRKLRDRAEPGPTGAEAVDAVIAKLKELRYLSDERYAVDFARLRQENRSLGRRRVQQDLQNKGIASPVITEALESAYKGVDEVALVRQHIERKRLQAPTDDKSTARILRRLTAAGFSSKSIFTVLRQLRSGESIDTAEAAIADD
ncbi:regulatory protein RecX [Terriglobus aquaticus]|uniref:Regulatory protein RecX n=1 Tax=Terriglobus aquaticus TaxID=940139 RepID=A0ABW9KF96_9BACT|nr:regulatory protein RecX [Terriglobus aquaticus]